MNMTVFRCLSDNFDVFNDANDQLCHTQQNELNYLDRLKNLITKLLFRLPATFRSKGII